ncbi:hypothetical protein [Burkholderia gladioli]|uniref:hypothetical protein n=1 Tax=Burkholderia gladioli TaxID=28095 RepID=UPI002FE07E69
MAVTYDKALEFAVQIVSAAAAQHPSGLKIDGVPIGHAEEAEEAGKKDGAYIAALLKTIANEIKTL